MFSRYILSQFHFPNVIDVLCVEIGLYSNANSVRLEN